jgi:hypothetical protein
MHYLRRSTHQCGGERPPPSPCTKTLDGPGCHVRSSWGASALASSARSFSLADARVVPSPCRPHRARAVPSGHARHSGHIHLHPSSLGELQPRMVRMGSLGQTAGARLGPRTTSSQRTTPVTSGPASSRLTGQTRPSTAGRHHARRLWRGCDPHQQTRPKPSRPVTATTGKIGSGRWVNREVLRLAVATLLVRRDQHERPAMRSTPQGLLVLSMTACRHVIADGIVAR